MLGSAELKNKEMKSQMWFGHSFADLCDYTFVVCNKLGGWFTQA